jgi:hypothetical protein
MSTASNDASKDSLLEKSKTGNYSNLKTSFNE